MIISPFNPVFFGIRSSDGIECPFTQFFAYGDTLRLQVIRTEDEEALPCYLNFLEGDDEPPAEGNPVISVSPSSQLAPSSYPMGGGKVLDTYSKVLQRRGFFTVCIGDFESEPFEVTADVDAIQRSVKIEYSPADNGLRRDVAAYAGGQRFWFAVRFPGGFKDSGYDFSVDNEQFVAQTSDIVELYSRESMQETLTVGWSRGVPVWFGQLLNRLLTCRYVYIDGLRYARYQSSVPEKTQTMDGVDSFTFVQKLQRINHLDPERP